MKKQKKGLKQQVEERMARIDRESGFGPKKKKKKKVVRGPKGAKFE